MSERVAMLVFNDFRNDSRVLKEARSLARAGYRVQVFALRKPDLPERELQHGFEVIRVEVDPWHLRLLRRLRTPGSSRPPEAPRARGGRLAAPRMRRFRRSLHDLLKPLLMPWHRSLCYLDYWGRVQRRLRDEPIRIFHAHDLNTLPVAWWLGRRRGRRLLYDSHELYVDRNRIPPRSRFGKRFTRWIEGMLIRRVDAVVTVNESIARVLAERYRIARPAVVMNAPDARQAASLAAVPDLRALCGVPADRTLLLYAGSLTFHRGLDKLIAALPLLPGCHLALMGPGAPAMLDELAGEAARHGVEGRVSFVPPVPSDQVSLVAAAADLGVAPIENVCSSYYLCSPNKLFEYLHAGLPVAASDFPELRRILDEHRCGRTFDPSDPSEIAACISRMLADPGGLARMRERAQRAAARYDWAIEEAKLLDEYRRLRRQPVRGNARPRNARDTEPAVAGEEP
jgi:glycosyltransferase involved in cell wall biosynthesis